MGLAEVEARFGGPLVADEYFKIGFIQGTDDRAGPTVDGLAPSMLEALDAPGRKLFLPILSIARPCPVTRIVEGIIQPELRRDSIAGHRGRGWGRGGGGGCR